MERPISAMGIRMNLRFNGFPFRQLTESPSILHHRNTSGSCARRSERTKGAHPDPAGFVADPEKFRLLRKLDRRDETTWPCNGVPGYVYGFFSKDGALRDGDISDRTPFSVLVL